MEFGALVMQPLTSAARAQLLEVLACFWDYVIEQLNDDAANRAAIHTDIQEAKFMPACDDSLR